MLFVLSNSTQKDVRNRFLKEERAWLLDIPRQLSLESIRAGIEVKEFNVLEQGFLDGRPSVQLFDVYFVELQLLKQFGRVCWCVV
jgi:hypothetical protein